MSATERAALKCNNEDSSFNDGMESEGEYQSLLLRLREVERKYKLGDVDEEVESADPTHNVCWAFEVELNNLEGLVKKYQRQLLNERPSWYYKFLAIQAEAKEYFDTATPSFRFDLYLLAQKLYLQLPKRVEWPNSNEEGEEHVTLKNMIRVIVSGLEYLHSIGDFGTAMHYAEGLYDFVVNKGLATKSNPAHGSRALICHFLGRTLRQRGIDEDYGQAIDYFYQSSESYFEMARRRGNKEVDVIYARTRAMVSLAFGAGFLYYNAQSDLVRAKAQIAQARLAFLRDNGTICCQLHYHYVELLYASILRAEAGEIIPDDDGDAQRQAERALAEEKLTQAGEMLQECAKGLKKKPKFFIHVLYNQALVYLYQGPAYYDEARACVNQLLEKCHDHTRWLANALVLKSHLERRTGDYETALADAMKAHDQAGNHLPVRIEALLARGQAQLARRQVSSARLDFEKALQLNNGANLKLTTMVYLLLAELAIAQHKPREAHEMFLKAKALMPSIRHGFILNKFRELETSIDNLQTDFIISGQTDELDYKKFEADLQRWVLEKALLEDSNLTRIAQRLNVAKKTVYMWLVKHNIKV